METKLPLGITAIPIKNILWSGEELVCLQGHSGDQANLPSPVVLPRNCLRYNRTSPHSALESGHC